jgi:alpha-1,2-glucosyltransferase
MAVFGDLVFLSSILYAMLMHGTLAHPYLLADNRHYTFYLWKDVLGPLRAALAPLYAVCAYEMGARLSRNQSWLVSAGFWVCAAATLIPARLLEFRYFTAPLVLFCLHLKPPPLPVAAAQLLCFAAVNAVTLAMLAERPFTWPDGSVARFMW